MLVPARLRRPDQIPSRPGFLWKRIFPSPFLAARLGAVAGLKQRYRILCGSEPLPFLLPVSQRQTSDELP